jgi:hypothetical protein
MGRRLRAAVVGDSVVWGQGHPQDRKFFNLAFAELRARGAVEIEVPEGMFTAQSGAHACNVDARNAFMFGRTPPPQVAPRNAISGENPSSVPSTCDQLRALAPRRAEIDLLVMDGGANDIDFTAAGMPFDSSQDEAVANATRYIAGQARLTGMDAKEYFFSRFFEDRLRSIQLALAESRSLQADHSFYTGYYPGLSESSPADEVAGMLAGGAAVAGVGVLSLLVSPLLGGFGLLAGLYAGMKATEEARQAGRQVEYFYARLTGEITRHIARHNLGDGGCVHYVNPRFPPERGMFQDGAWVYAPTDAGDPEIQRARIAHYKARTGKEPDYFVQNAHVAHPNAAGSAQYGRRLAEEIDRVVNFSLRREGERMGDVGSVAALLGRLPVHAYGSSVRALLRLSVIETVEFVYVFRHTQLVIDGDGEDHFLSRRTTLFTRDGEVSGRFFRTQKRLEAFFDLRGRDYKAVGELAFEFDSFNILRDEQGSLAVYVNGYEMFRGEMDAGRWSPSPRPGHARFVLTLR